MELDLFITALMYHIIMGLMKTVMYHAIILDLSKPVMYAHTGSNNGSGVECNNP